MNTDYNARIMKLMRSLERHKERYLRAWMAHYGAHPSQVHIVMFPKTADIFGDERGEIMRLEYRKDTDEVAELVKAARDAADLIDDIDPGPSGIRSVPLRAALARFERQAR